MSLYENQKQALIKLLSLQNQDGGIPATLASQESGCWTSISVLLSVCKCLRVSDFDADVVEKLLNFVLSNQIKAKEDTEGGWALFGGDNACVMSTGDAISALTSAFKVFPNHRNKIQSAINSGVSWLEESQNADGSWGSFPYQGHEGKVGRTVAIHHAIMGLLNSPNGMQTKHMITRATAYLFQSQRVDGGWGETQGKESNVCDTSRSIIALVSSGQFHPTDAKIKKGLEFISNKLERQSSSWEIETESMHISGSLGQIVINRNTNCDAITAFSVCKINNKKYRKVLSWLFNSQDDDDLWTLSSENKRIEEIKTWSTAEWVMAIEHAKRNLFTKENTTPKPRISKPYVLVSINVIIIILLIAINADARQYIITLWDYFPVFIQNIILGTLILGTIGSVIGSYIYDKFLRKKT